MPDYTDFYDFPYPLLTDAPDGAGQMKALAETVENTLKNGYWIPNGGLGVGGGTLSVPSGDVSIGNASRTTQAQVVLYKKHATTADTYLAYLVVYEPFIALILQKNGVEVNRLEVNEDGSVTILALLPSPVRRPIPFAVTAGTTTAVLSNVAYASNAVTFPTGRFTQPPLVTVTSASNVAFYGFCASILAASATIGVSNRDNTAVTVNVAAHYHAIQMTPGSGPGLREAPEHTHLATCHTEGCGNVDAPIPVVLESDTGVVCGPCGLPIEDVVAP